jgi:hypothetical protein
MIHHRALGGVDYMKVCGTIWRVAGAALVADLRKGGRAPEDGA